MVRILALDSHVLPFHALRCCLHVSLWDCSGTSEARRAAADSICMFCL